MSKVFHFPLTEDDLNGVLVKNDAIRKYIASILAPIHNEIGPAWTDDDTRRLNIHINNTWDDAPQTFGVTRGRWYVDGMTLDIMVLEDGDDEDGEKMPTATLPDCKFIAIVYYASGDKQSDSFQGKWTEISLWLAGQDEDNISSVSIGRTIATG